MTGNLIRPAAAADAEQISALVHEIVPTLGYGTEEQVDRFLVECYSPEVIRAGIADGTHRYFVAVDTAASVGGAIYINARTSYLGGLHVRARRQGIGRALMAAALELSDSLGIDVLKGSVLSTNAPSISLLTQFGFRLGEADTDYRLFPDADFVFAYRHTR